MRKAKKHLLPKPEFEANRFRRQSRLKRFASNSGFGGRCFFAFLIIEVKETRNAQDGNQGENNAEDLSLIHI